MNYLATQYSLRNRAFEIYLSGCRGVNGQHCKDCHNPQTWDFNQGTPALINGLLPKEILNKIYNNLDMIEKIWILGGEPLDQDPEELEAFITDLNMMFPTKEIWLFTRKEIEEVPYRIKPMCSYIKTGAYIPELKVEGYVQHGITLATSNQRVHKIN